MPKIQQKGPKEMVQRVNSLDLDPRCQTKRSASGAKGTHILVINVLPKTQRAGFARNKATLSGHVSKKKEVKEPTRGRSDIRPGQQQ